jgi:5-methylcytosine-specific restriction endonuclease McrA
MIPIFGPRLEEVSEAVDRAREEREARARAKPSKDAKAAFYSSLAWRRLRYSALAANAKEHGGIAQCVLCATRAAPGAPLNGDHIEPVSKNWARRLDPTNVQILCEPCNHGKLNLDSIDWRAAEDDRPADVDGHGDRVAPGDGVR